MINLIFNENGLNIPSYEDIYNDFLAKIKAKMGDDFYLDSESPDAQYLAILALAQYDTCLALQQMISSMYPSTAQGVNLDRICSYQNISRFVATSSICPVNIVGKPGTTISNMIVSDVNNELWNVEDGTISELGTITLNATSVNPSIYAGIGEIVNIVEAPKDVESVKNTQPCIQGRKNESDAELRKRRTSSVLMSSVGTIDAVYGSLINLDGVSNLNVLCNVEDVTVDTVPANTLCVSILGGDATEIAKIISNKKSPGCNLVGTTEVSLQKGNYVETIKFYRPEYVQCKIQVIITPLTNYAEEYGQQIANKIKEYVSSLHIGEYIYIGKLYQLCYSVITDGMPFNIKQINLQVHNGGDFQPTQDNIPVSPINILTLAENGLEVVDGK